MDVLKQRLDNYIKAITYVQKYDSERVKVLLEKAEKLKTLQKNLKQGQEIDR